MKKRFLSLFLALALCLGLVPTAFAAEKTTYYLAFNAVTTAKNSEISISGEGLALTERINCEGGLGAGQLSEYGDYLSYPVFTASKSVTVTITADYTDWGKPVYIPERGGYNWDTEQYVYSAQVFGVSGTNEYGYPKSNWKDLAYFDGTYAVRLENGSMKENVGKLKDHYMNNRDKHIYIYPGATVTLSEPGDYLISVLIGNLWMSMENYAIIHIVSDGTFTDVSSGAFYAKAVDWAVANGITTGKTAATFAPSQNCTHAQILTFLWRAAGSPESSAQPPISMKGNEFYYKAVKWAAEKGMIGKNFNPNAPCNRAYAVQYIWQAMGKPAPAKANPFTDIPAHWSSAPAAAWAAEKGIAAGTSATRFSPAKICTRGEIVTFLHRAYVPSARLK